ncbi:MAG: HEPN domain-containing protein [Phycisphaerae bacterium]|nr:HEPN domain-containing protein [Phycisphaerae bacterium]
MSTPRDELVQYRMERAWETLEEAELMFSSNHLHGAANRLYYACFYAVCALLAHHEMSSTKHGGVLSLFNRHFVKEGVISVSYGKFYSKLFNSRTEGDYGDMLSEIEISKDDFAEAKEFIANIRELIYPVKS